MRRSRTRITKTGNRKNALFVVDRRGGRAATIMSSLASIGRRGDIDRQRCFTRLVADRPTTHRSQLDR